MSRRREPVRWVAIATYGSGWEAEIGRAVLQAGGFDAVVQGGEWVGIFGLSFQGSTPRGVTVAVPSHQLEAARTYLAFRERADDDEPDAPLPPAAPPGTE